MSNYPLGAKYDPNAPGNQDSPETKKVNIVLTISKEIELETYAFKKEVVDGECGKEIITILDKQELIEDLIQQDFSFKTLNDFDGEIDDIKIY